MYNPLRKFFPSTPQPALAAAGMSGAIPLIPSKFGGYTDPALEPKSSLGTRILQGLPGAAAQVGIVMGAKAATTAALSSTLSSTLLAGVAPVALTPLITGAGALAAGLAVAQSFKYARERMETLSKEQGRTINLKTIYNEASLAGIAREAALFRKEAFSWNFVKKAVHNGKLGIALGASLGIADHTDLGHEALSVAKEKASGLLRLAGEKTVNLALLAKEKIQAGLANGEWKNPPKRLAEMTSGKAHANVVPKPSVPTQLAQTTDTKPQLSHPLDTVPVDPPTPLEKIRILMEVKGTASNVALDKMIARAESGDMQAVKDLAMGLNNGKLGLPMHKTLGMELLKIAAEGKNPQAIRDLAFLTKGTVAAAVVDTPKSQTLAPRGIAADSREKAMAFIRSLTGSGDAAQQGPAPKVAVPQAAAPSPTLAAPLPTSEIVDRNADTLARAYTQVQQTAGNVHSDPAAQFAHDYALNKAPSRLADEASRCVMGVGEAGKRAIHTMCSFFKDAVTPNDTVLMQSADQSLSAPYSPESTQPTNKFTEEARKHFRANDFMPKFGAQLQ